MNKAFVLLLPLVALSGTAQAGASASDMDCLFNWAEKNYSQLFSPAGAASQSTGPYYYRQYGSTYLGVNQDNQHAVLLTGGAMSDLGDVAPFLATAGCAATPVTPVTPGTTSYAGTWTWSAGAYYSVQFVLTQNGNDLTATIPSTKQHFTGKLNGNSAVFTEDDGTASAQATVTLVSANAVDLKMDSCSGMCLLQPGNVIRLTR